MKTIHFEDNGQDLLEMDLDHQNRIMSCRPALGIFFNGSHVNPETLLKGRQLYIIGRGYFRHKIESIEHLPDPVIITEHEEDIQL